MYKLWKTYLNREIILSVTVSLAIVFLFLLATGVIPYEFYLADDYQALAIKNALQKSDNGFLSIFFVMRNWMLSDIHIRFRPIYWVIRVLRTAIFGVDFNAWAIWIGIESATTLFVLYWCGRKLKQTIGCSVIFALVTTVGPQLSVWYRQGPQEGTGLLFFAMGFWGILNYLEKRGKISLLVGISCVVLSTLTKESFVIMIPAVVYYIIWNSTDNIYDLKSWLASVKYHIGTCSLLVLIMIAEVYVIITITGTNSIGYAGINPSTKLTEYIQGFKTTAIAGRYMGLAMCLLFGMLLYHTIVIEKAYLDKKRIINIMVEFCFILLCIIPQLLLYAKSGMFERYFIPFSFGCAYFVIFVHKQLSKNKMKKNFKIIIGLLLCGQLTMGIEGAILLAVQGEENIEIFQYILDETKNTDQIVFTLNWVENNGAAKIWLNYYGRENISYYSREEEVFVGINGIDEATIVVIKDVDEERIMLLDWDLSEYDRTEVGVFDVYMK